MLVSKINSIGKCHRSGRLAENFKILSSYKGVQATNTQEPFDLTLYHRKNASDVHFILFAFCSVPQRKGLREFTEETQNISLIYTENRSK